MALLEYKIAGVSHNGSHASAIVRVYRGTMQDITVTSPNGTQRIENQYVRAAKVRDFNLEYDIPRTMDEIEFLRKARARLNARIIDFANANGHTVVNYQQDVSENEPVHNENET